MTTGQYFLNLALLAWILSSNVGSRVLTRRRVTVPLLVVLAAGWAYLNDLPVAGHDARLELVGLLAGVVAGVVAALTVRVRLVGERVVATAGLAFVAVWVVVIGGRVLFAYGAEHWFARSIGQFSYEHQITGASAWTAAFVIMALAMVVTRLGVTGVRAARLTARARTEQQTVAPVALYR